MSYIIIVSGFNISISITFGKLYYPYFFFIDRLILDIIMMVAFSKGKLKRCFEIDHQKSLGIKTSSLGLSRGYMFW